jgi:pyruvate, water dikinase
MVLPLKQVTDEQTHGGKAVQLGAALRAGFPVPDGFALSTSAVDDIANRAPHAITLVREHFSALRGPVAVRSSAVGEDSANASFAGQHATLLNVRTEDALVDAICHVRASAHTESAMAYRKRMGIHRPARMAVVVQRLVNAEVAGILFTRNPHSGADERVIEASYGLGEAIVAGLVTPDRFRVARNGAILERTLGEKDIAIRPHASGGAKETPVESNIAQVLCLRDQHLSELHALASRCEEHFGGAHDMEFAFAEGRLFLLQRRAITRS